MRYDSNKRICGRALTIFKNRGILNVSAYNYISHSNEGGPDLNESLYQNSFTR